MIAFSSSQRKQLTCVDEAVGHVPQGKAERHSQECLHGQTVIAERRAIAGDSEKPAEAGDAISSTHPGTDACRAALTATEKYNCEILASIVTVVFDRRPGKKPSQPDALVRCKTATRSQPPSLCSRCVPCLCRRCYSQRPLSRTLGEADNGRFPFLVTAHFFTPPQAYSSQDVSRPRNGPLWRVSECRQPAASRHVKREGVIASPKFRCYSRVTRTPPFLRTASRPTGRRIEPQPCVGCRAC